MRAGCAIPALTSDGAAAGHRSLSCMRQALPAVTTQPAWQRSGCLAVEPCRLRSAQLGRLKWRAAADAQSACVAAVQHCLLACTWSPQPQRPASCIAALGACRARQVLLVDLLEQRLVHVLSHELSVPAHVQVALPLAQQLRQAPSIPPHVVLPTRAVSAAAAGPRACPGCMRPPRLEPSGMLPACASWPRGNRGWPCSHRWAAAPADHACSLSWCRAAPGDLAKPLAAPPQGTP